MKKFFVGLLAAIGAFTLLITVGIFVIISLSGPRVHPLQQPTILTIEISGPLVENDHVAELASLLGGKPMALKDIVDAIDQAAKDTNVVALVLRLDHAKIGLAQAQEIRDAVKRFRKANTENPKLTIAFADSYGEASGTIPYYLATACQEIWLQPMGSVGLTGLYAESPFAREALDSLKLKPQVEGRREYKSLTESLTETDFTPASREALKVVLESFMQQISKDIGKSRKLASEQVRALVDKGPFLTQEAFDSGLVDKLGYFDEVPQWLSKRTDQKLPMISTGKYLRRTPLLQAKPGQAKIALIYGEGNIHRDRSHRVDPFGNLAMGAREMSYAFKKAVEDPDVAAIVLRINSGGGSPVASESIARAVTKAQSAGLPVIVSMSDMTASGGYWIAAFADKIVAHPGTLTGSIGVAAGKMVTGDFWAHWGINWKNVHVGENAGMWSSSEQFSQRGWQRLNASLDAIYDAFLERVARGRNMSLGKAESVAKGRIWSGSDALKLGLVDQLGGMQVAIELAKQEAKLVDIEVPVEVFPHPLTVPQQILKLLNPDENDETVSVGIMPQIMASIMRSVIAAKNWVLSGNDRTVEVDLAVS
ncbi:MAG: signal peptide peptidase SppA [Pseudomonadota bacterium]